MLAGIGFLPIGRHTQSCLDPSCRDMACLVVPRLEQGSPAPEARPPHTPYKPAAIRAAVNVPGTYIDGVFRGFAHSHHLAPGDGPRMPFPQPLDLEIRPNTSAEDDEHTLRTQRNAMGRSMPSPPQPFMKLYRNLVDSDRPDRRGYCREMTEWLTTFLEDPALYGSELCRLQVRHEIRLVKQHTCPAMTGAQFKVFNQAAQMVRTELDPCDSITGQVWASVCRFEIQQYQGRYTNANDAIPREAKQCHRAAQAFDSHPTDEAFWTFRAAYNGERLRQATMQAKPTPRQLGPPLPPPEPTPPKRRAE